MPFAAVLTRASCCFFLRLSRFHARKRNSGSSLNRLPMLRHLVNLQAPITLRQGIPLLLCEPSAHSASLRYLYSSLFALEFHPSTTTTLAPSPSIWYQWRCSPT